MDSALRTSCLAFMQFLSASDQPDPQSSRSYLTGAGLLLLLTMSPLRSFSSQLLFDEAVVFETVVATEVTTVSLDSAATEVLAASAVSDILG